MTAYEVRVDMTQAPLAGSSLAPIDAAGPAAASDLNDSDATKDGNDGVIAVKTGAPGQTNHTYDIGVKKPARLGDFVWEDLDKNGIQDAGEPAIADVVVNLLDLNNAVLKTTRTNQDGLYLFDNLDPGIYIVEFTKPVGFGFTEKDTGADDAKDSDADTATGRTMQITLNSGDDNMTVDGGVVRVAATQPTTTTTEPTTTKPTEPTTTKPGPTTTEPPTTRPPFTVPPFSEPTTTPTAPTTTKPAPTTTTPVSSSTSQPTETTTTAPTVTTTTTAVTTTAPGATTTAPAVTSSNVTSTSATTVPATVAATIPTIIVIATAPTTPAATTPAPTTVAPTSTATTTPTTPATAATTTATSPPPTVAATTTTAKSNLGCLGDLVWNDRNGNGVRDAGEPGLPDVWVGIVDATSGAVIQELFTDSTGAYMVCGLPAGSYKVSTKPPAGLPLKPTYDVDGVNTPNTARVTLGAGENRTDVDFGFNDGNIKGDDFVHTVTGSSSGTYTGIAVLLLLIGAGLMLIVNRRRGNHTFRKKP